MLGEMKMTINMGDWPDENSKFSQLGKVIATQHKLVLKKCA